MFIISKLVFQNITSVSNSSKLIVDDKAVLSLEERLLSVFVKEVTHALVLAVELILLLLS